MHKDTARSVLAVLEHALNEGDRKIAESHSDETDEWDKRIIAGHNETKKNIEHHVLEPIRRCFPPKVDGPVDLIGWKVEFGSEGLPGDGYKIEGLVVEVAKNNTAHVVVRVGIRDYDVHWGLCRVVV